MSKISIKPITCPTCNNKGEFKMYDSVNVSLNPELKEKVLTGQIFEWKCPQCGETLSIRYDLLYHDMDKGFQIYYSPNNCKGLNSMIDNMLTKYPGMRKTCRTVDTINALREKIYIFEAGLNDIAVELSKLIIRYDEQNPIPMHYELRFEKYLPINEDPSVGKLIFRKILNGQPQKGLILFDKLNYNNFFHEVSTNDSFRMTKYCDTIDEKWIMTRLT